MVFYHGGGAVAGDVDSVIPLMNRIAMESNCLVINCNYGLGPEVPAPGGIHDGYSCLKDIIARAEKNELSVSVDPTKIGIFGGSGGGYIVAGI